MRVDITSMFFNSTIEGQTATAAWATSIAKQSKPCLVYENQECANIINGMLFCSKSDKENLSIKGMSSTRELIMFSIFDKVKANGKRIDGSFILLLVREHSASHDGRILLSYPMYAQYQDDNIFVSNEETKNKIANSIGCSNEGCWFVYDISIENQDTLCFKAKVVDPNNSKVYKVSSKERSKEWKELIGEPDKDSGLGDGEPLQQIFYGAPGTGKSHGIKKEIKKLTGMDDDENNPYVFRTTFHPDYDYAQFVGCYKPVKDPNDKQKITYEFIPQAFTNAYVKAYQNESHVVLVIEEINRGNCAQIFGDIFQLLDRNTQGVSEYSIRPDQDLLEYLREKCPESVSGDRMKLPSNMSILATMNTSDQSLFPMDSAFKRRWDWKYVPIEIGRDKDGKALKWKIVADENEYDWMSFVTEINKRIYKATESEDKQLGFFFCKADAEGVISVDVFTSKVLSYLWMDVFKDSDFDSDVFEDGNGGKITFASLYDNIDNIKEELVAKFIENVGTKKVGEVVYYDDDTENTDEVQQNGVNTKNRDYSKYIINGRTDNPLNKRKLVREAVNMFVRNNSQLSVNEMLNELRKYDVGGLHFVDSEDEYYERFKDSNDTKQSQRAHPIKWGEKDENKIYVSAQWGVGNIEKFLKNFKVDGIKIEKYQD